MPELRRYYENIRSPARTVRRGRDPNVPIGLYQDIDEITRRLDVMGGILGVTSETLGKNPPVASRQPNVVNVGGLIARTVPVSFAFTGTAGASSSSVVIPIATPFLIKSAVVNLEISAGPAFADITIYAGGESIYNSLQLPFRAFGIPGQTIFFAQLHGDNFKGNEQARISGQPPGFTVTGKVYAANTEVYVSAANASASSRIGMTLTIVEFL